MVEGLGIGDGSRTGGRRVHYDSQSALLLAQNSVYHGKIKYIDIKYHQIRELVEEDEVELVKVHTKENLANALIKVLLRDSFRKYVTLMYLIDRMELVEALGHQGGDCWTLCGAFKAQKTKAKAKIQIS